MCDAFKRAYDQMGVEIGRVPIPLKTINMKKHIVQLAKLKPNFALAVFVGGEADVFFKDYYRFKVNEKIPLVALSGAVSPKRLQSYQKTLEQYGTGVGLLASEVYNVEAESPVNKHFVSLVHQTHDKRPGGFEMWGYDAGRLRMKALVEMKGQWDGREVVRLMKTLSYKSPRHGQELQFDTHGDAINGAYVTKLVLEKGQLVKKLVDQVPSINMDELLK